VKVTDFSVERPVSITMLVLIVLVLGGIAFTRLGIDMLPDVDYPTLSVMVRYPGAPSQEIESLVTRNYEAALASIDNLESIRSVSQEDVCYLMLDFVWGTDLDAAAADIREAVALIEPYMPPDVEDPIVIKFNLSSFPSAVYAVSGMKDTIALRDLMKDTVQSRLERLPGVAQAAFLGGRTEEIQVNLDRTALAGSGISPDRVLMALAAQNMNLPAGRQVAGRKEYLLRTVGMFKSLEDIKKTAVGMSPRTGAPIYLRTIADVKRTTKDVRSMVRVGGLESLMMMIMKESGANPLRVRRAYMEELEKLKELLPKEIHFDLLMDTGRVIELLADSVTQNGIVGALLAVVIMYLFLRNARPTATIAVVIPLSLLTTFIPMYFMGETLNMMTMGGLVLGIGMLVDNAVVVIENIFRHLEKGEDRRTAAKRGAGEVGMAISASTFTTMVVFLPILFSQGLAGQLARGLAITVAAALFSSLFVALTIVPSLASIFFSSGSTLRTRAGGRFERFKSRYQQVLAWCLDHRKATFGALGALFLLTVGMAFMVGAEFMPDESRPILVAKLSLPVGTPLEETSRVARRVERVFEQFDDVLVVGTMLGVDENDVGAGMSQTSNTGVHEAMLWARLKEKGQRKIPGNKRLQAKIREALPELDQVEFEFIDMASNMGGGSNRPIDIKLFGADFDKLKLWSERVADTISRIPKPPTFFERIKALFGVESESSNAPLLVDVDTTMRVAKPEEHIVIDRDKAATYGLTVGQIANTIKTATLGTVATRFRESGKEIDVRVRYAEPYRADRRALEQILLSLPTGGTIPLGQVARIEVGEGPVKISRENQSRVVSITADIADTNLNEAMGLVQEAIAPLIHQLPQGYMVEFGGEFADMIDAFIQLLEAMILAVLMVYMVMASQFESLSHPFTVMFTMPLAFMGVIWIFFLTGTTLSVPSFLGVIMLAGIVVNNGIVMVDYINQLRQQGLAMRQAVIEGASTRLRPVLITSLTTITAMLPMAISKGEGSETMSPLALTVIGGLFAATLFTLIIVPLAYTLVDHLSSRIASFWIQRLHGTETNGVG